MILLYHWEHLITLFSDGKYYSAFTETTATQTMKTKQEAELKQ